MKRENVTPMSVSQGNKMLKWYLGLEEKEIEYNNYKGFLDCRKHVKSKSGHIIAIVSIHFYNCKLDSIMITYVDNCFHTFVYDFAEMIKCVMV